MKNKVSVRFFIRRLSKALNRKTFHSQAEFTGAVSLIFPLSLSIKPLSFVVSESEVLKKAMALTA